LKDGETVIYPELKNGIARMGAAIIPQLIDLLEYPGGRARAVQALGLIGAEARSVLPQLILLLDDRDAQMQEMVAFALGEIGEASSMIPHLIPLLDDLNADVFYSAVFALGKMGASAEAIPHLIPLLTDPDELARSQAA
jgi:HEAT repeat protein